MFWRKTNAGKTIYSRTKEGLLSLYKFLKTKFAVLLFFQLSANIILVIKTASKRWRNESKNLKSIGNLLPHLLYRIKKEQLIFVKQLSVSAKFKKIYIENEYILKMSFQGSFQIQTLERNTYKIATFIKFRTIQTKHRSF